MARKYLSSRDGPDTNVVRYMDPEQQHPVGSVDGTMMSDPVRGQWRRPRRRVVPVLGLFVVAGLLLLLFLPLRPLFVVPYSTVLLDREGELLGATTATDGQWRMPPGDSVPWRFERCLLEFEDRLFRSHPGIHVPSLLRAWRQNRAAGRTVSGGSTLTMQVARLSVGNGRRTLLRKLREMVLALRIEAHHSKDEILALYCAHAPFGGNVVGLEAAAWRWFGRPAHLLGWGECATLAVLPNAPATIHPGRGRDALKAKRDRLLARLRDTGDIDSLQWSLAVDEPLPDAPLPLPQLAPHLLATLRTTGHEGQRVRSTLDRRLQLRTSEAVERHGHTLRANEVHNAAVLVLDVRTGDVLAYVGNVPGTERAAQVDIVRAPRSTGSLLKPFLYAAMLQAGERAPHQLVADVPTRYEGFAPSNHDRQYGGAVPASQALSRSLNVPAVRALREHGVERALRLFRAMGLTHLRRTADHYGLALVVGGAESTLWELTGAYASLARIVEAGPSATRALVHPPRTHAGPTTGRDTDEPVPLRAAAVYHTLLALQQAERPDNEAGWRHFADARQVAWKTGTSQGHRDAWAIGTTTRHTVGVWAGNASGEGRTGLTGSLAAAPLLFEVFALLPSGTTWEAPYDQLERLPLCRASGHPANVWCGPVDTTWTIAAASRVPPCPYHKPVLVDREGRHRVRPAPDARQVAWFILPPAMEHYYAPRHPGYAPLPPWTPGSGDAGDVAFDVIYPEAGSRIHVPLLLDGTTGRVVFHAAHRDPGATLFWDLDGTFIGSTTGEHLLATEPTHGTHRLTLTDREGRSIAVPFAVERAPGRP
jgi:penicillin-binding protein 1C